jgi:hypothetical protein
MEMERKSCGPGKNAGREYGGGVATSWKRVRWQRGYHEDISVGMQSPWELINV